MNRTSLGAELQILILAAGDLESDFRKAGFELPKNQILIDGESLLTGCIRHYLKISEDIKVVINSIENEKYKTSSLVSQALNSGNVTFTPIRATPGALCSALLSIDSLDSGKPILLVPVDVILRTDEIKGFLDFCLLQDLDAALVSTDSFEDRWSFIRKDSEHNLLQISPKIAITSEVATGMYFYKNLEVFLASAEFALVNFASEDYPYHLSQTMVASSICGYKTKVFNVDFEKINFLASPGDFRKYILDSSKKQS
jgi:hypothetical protein